MKDNNEGLWFLIIICIMALLSMQSAKAHHADAPGLTDNMETNTWVVLSQDAEKGRQGTGFHIGGGWMVTAGHVIGNDSAKVTVMGDDVYVAHWQNDDEGDWALLHVPFLLDEPSALRVACAARPSNFDELIIYGAPSGLLMMGRGVIQHVGDDFLIYTLGVHLGHGASGAAVVDPVTGRVVGIHTAMAQTEDDMNTLFYATPISAFKEVCP